MKAFLAGVLTAVVIAIGFGFLHEVHEAEWIIMAVKTPGSMAINDIQADMDQGRYDLAKERIDILQKSWQRFLSGPDACTGIGISDIQQTFGMMPGGINSTNIEPMITTSAKETATNTDIAIEDYAALVDYLSKTKQTNALNELNGFLSDERTLQRGADLSVTVAILEGLRGGKTNEMLGFFENRLDDQIGLFGSGYGALPVELQKQMSLEPLQRARDYRNNFPSTNTNRFSREEVTNAFKLLDGK